MVPSDFVGHRRDVIHPVDDRHVLVVVEDLGKLFKTAVQKSDVRLGFDDRLAVEFQHQTQGRVGRWVLRTEVQCPQAFAVAGIQVRRFDQVQRHLI